MRGRGCRTDDPSDIPAGREAVSILPSVSRALGAYERHVRRARTADLGPVAWALAAALHDDPAVSWLVPDAGRRRATVPSVMELFAQHDLPRWDRLREMLGAHRPAGPHYYPML